MSNIEEYKKLITKASKGRYRVKQLVGKGAMGVVLKAEDTYLTRTVAIKLILPQYTSDEDFVYLFFREARLQAQFQHPGIVKIYDFNPQGEVVFFVMELIDGLSLKKLIKKQRLSFSIVCLVINQLAETLSYAHHGSVKMFHRDLKPGNILIDTTGRCLITDFGLSKAVSSSCFTATGDFRGTPAYMAPEQIEIKQEQDHRIDCYALGVIMFELAAGIRPFVADSYLSLMYMHVNEAPPPVREIDPTIPEWYEKIIFKCLAKNPQNRYNNTLDIANEIEKHSCISRETKKELSIIVNDVLSKSHSPLKSTIIRSTPTKTSREADAQIWVETRIGAELQENRKKTIDTELEIQTEAISTPPMQKVNTLKVKEQKEKNKQSKPLDKQKQLKKSIKDDYKKQEVLEQSISGLPNCSKTKVLKPIFPIALLIIITIIGLLLWKPWEANYPKKVFFYTQLDFPLLNKIELPLSKKDIKMIKPGNEGKSNNNTNPLNIKKDKKKNKVEKTRIVYKYAIPSKKPILRKPNKTYQQPKEIKYMMCPKCKKKFFNLKAKFCDQCPGVRLIPIQK